MWVFFLDIFKQLNPSNSVLSSYFIRQLPQLPLLEIRQNQPKQTKTFFFNSSDALQIDNFIITSTSCSYIFIMIFIYFHIFIMIFIIISSVLSCSFLLKVATKTADRSLLPPAPAPGVLAPGAWISLTRGGRSFKGMVTAVKEKEMEVRFKTSISAKS